MVNVSTADKAQYLKLISIIQSVCGWIIALFFGPVSLVGFTQLKEVSDTLTMLILFVFAVLGVRLAMLGRKKRKLLTKYRDYSARLAGDADKSLIRLATEANEPADQVTKAVSEMIEAGLFPNCFIDTVNCCLVTPDSQAENTAAVEGKQNVSYVTVKCKSCGAPNTIPQGTVAECEFCGSRISQ